MFTLLPRGHGRKRQRHESWNSCRDIAICQPPRTSRLSFHTEEVGGEFLPLAPGQTSTVALNRAKNGNNQICDWISSRWRTFMSIRYFRGIKEKRWFLRQQLQHRMTSKLKFLRKIEMPIQATILQQNFFRELRQTRHIERHINLLSQWLLPVRQSRNAKTP